VSTPMFFGPRNVMVSMFIHFYEKCIMAAFFDEKLVKVTL
jgi:hypothetical protein